MLYISSCMVYLKRLYIIFISLYVYVDYLRVNKLSLLITLYCLQNYKLRNKKIRWYNELKRKTNNNIKSKEDKMMLKGDYEETYKMKLVQNNE